MTGSARIDKDDRFTRPLFTAPEAAQHLAIPVSTMYYWLREEAAGSPLVHRIEPEKRGWPTVPFVGLVEAHVLRALRDRHLTKRKIREAAAAIRHEFHTEYGLASARMATDGIDILMEYDNGDLVRAVDKQTPIREVIAGSLTYVDYGPDGYPSRLRLQKYSTEATVIIDPRFAWGAPIVEENKVSVDTIVDLWRAGESIHTVADEFDLTPDVVEDICRHAA